MCRKIDTDLMLIKSSIFIAFFNLGQENILEIDLAKYDEFETDILRNGQIQKFEYTIELLWKTLKKYFEVKRDKIILYPKDAIKAFFAEDTVDEETYLDLMNAIESRYLLSHIYRVEIFDLIYPQLKGYAKAIRHTCAALEPYTIQN